MRYLFGVENGLSRFYQFYIGVLKKAYHQATWRHIVLEWDVH